ncbi:hypothetical protein C0Q70_00174 [Pomacea canaliculata]|uniref:Ionotropic glutamate receptor C-terminal domain-containing protein n=1 Tax=Pomacea canaliculata TaxID=400727 RepID=A0A2T7PVY5_POMCA|nr:hypothetical protein C0Q70_00174 [Pomacea canaliculata]
MHILRQALAELNLTSADLTLAAGTAHDITWSFADGRTDNCSVVVVAATCQRAEMLKTAFSNSSLPLLIYSDDICDQAFTLSPWSTTTWTRAAVDVIVALRWTDVILVYDETSRGYHWKLRHENYSWTIVCPALQSSHLHFVDQNASNMAALFLAPRDSSSLQTTCSHRPEEYVLCIHQGSGPLSFQPVGVWSSTSGLTMFNVPKPDGVFFNKTLRVGVLEAIPFLKRLSDQSDNIVYEGLCIDILQELSHRLNFSYQLIESTDGLLGAPTANGSWNGLVAMLLHDELDLAIGPLTITSVRQSVIDFTVPYMEDGGAILTKGDKPPDLLYQFRPFSPGVWLLLCAYIVMTGAVLFTICKVNSACGVSGGQHTAWSLQDCILLTFSSFVSQGFERYPTCTPARLVLGCWWVFSILIVSMYTATLAAMLTVTVGVGNIDSIDDLAESSLTPITLAGSSWETLFLTAKSGAVQNVGRRMVHSPYVKTDADAVKYVMEGSAAYIEGQNIISYLYNKDCKHLHITKDTFISMGLGFAVPKNANYREQMNTVLLELQESGLMNLWRSRWWGLEFDCDNHDGSVRSYRQLDFVSIGGVLILYLAVITLAIVCLFAQLFYKQRKRCRSQKLQGSSTNLSDALHQSQKSHESKTSEKSSENTSQSSLSSDV